MTTAIIGVGELGTAISRLLVQSGEPVVLAARDDAHAAGLAAQLGSLASSASLSQAIASADTVVFAVWLDTLTPIITANADLPKGKVVLDRTNPLKVDGSGAFVRSLPKDQSSASVIAALLPPEAHYVKAFGSIGAASLGASANRSPRRAVLFYATDYAQAAAAAERLISAAGFDAIQAGGVKDAARIEGPDGDLSQFGRRGALLDADEARAAVAATAAA
jgi:8-hydroxy-5-deazaflavin:NADPH oxidoreductase